MDNEHLKRCNSFYKALSENNTEHLEKLEDIQQRIRELERSHQDDLCNYSKSMCNYCIAKRCKKNIATIGIYNQKAMFDDIKHITEVASTILENKNPNISIMLDGMSLLLSGNSSEVTERSLRIVGKLLAMIEDKDI